MTIYTETFKEYVRTIYKLTKLWIKEVFNNDEETENQDHEACV